LGRMRVFGWLMERNDRIWHDSRIPRGCWVKWPFPTRWTPREEAMRKRAATIIFMVILSAIAGCLADKREHGLAGLFQGETWEHEAELLGIEISGQQRAPIESERVDLLDPDPLVDRPLDALLSAPCVHLEMQICYCRDEGWQWGDHRGNGWQQCVNGAWMDCDCGWCDEGDWRPCGCPGTWVCGGQDCVEDDVWGRCDCGRGGE